MIGVQWETVATKVGNVVDYCSFCLKLRSFSLYKIVSQTGMTIAMIAIDRYSTSPEYAKRCDSCEMIYATKLDEYAGVADKKLSFDDLLAQTHPAVRERYAAELEMIQAAIDRRCSHDDLMALLRNPFQMLSRHNPTQNKETAPFTLGLAWGGGIAALSGLMAAIIARQAGMKPAQFQIVGGLVFAMTGFVATPVSIVIASRRAKRKRAEMLYLQLARALAPLRPERDELAEVFKYMADVGLEIIYEVDVETVLKYIEREYSGNALITGPLHS